MILCYLFLVPTIYYIGKLLIYFIVKKYGKFSYDGFSAAGFAYNPEKDIFYSTKNAWQKNLGYSHIYDVAAPIGRMIIDTEPIRFYYNNKNWLITFWKGQYGITTGGEVGIYCTSEQKVNKKTLYLPIKDEEMLDMCFTLYKKDKIITKVCARHWWLAVFKLGMFSQPKDLSMDIMITFPNSEMLDAFFKSFKKLHYRKKDYMIVDNTFMCKYKKQHKRIWTRSYFTDMIIQHYNKKNVYLYNKYLQDSIDNNKIDDSKSNKKQIIINNIIPDILKNGKEKTTKETDKFVIKDKKNLILLREDIYPNTGDIKNVK